MPCNRYFTSSELIEGTLVELQGKEAHHLIHVARGVPEEIVELVNGRGYLSEARIQSISKKTAMLIIHTTTFTSKTTQKIILAQAIPRLNRLDTIVEKGTELGMQELWLFPGEKSEKKSLSDHQLDRLASIAINAMKQCGCLYLPKIKMLGPLAKWDIFPNKGFFGDILPDAPPLCTLLPTFPDNNPLLFFTGPESGFSQTEEKILKSHGITGAKLHNNILRTDTASIAALSIISLYSI